MKCPNCGREESWEDASFCPRCGKQLISIFVNECKSSVDKEDKKIRMQIFQIGIWVFLTVASFLLLSNLVPKDWIGTYVSMIAGVIMATLVMYWLRTDFFGPISFLKFITLRK